MAEWTCRVEWILRSKPGRARVDGWMTRFAEFGHHPGIGFEYGGKGRRVRATAGFILAAESLQDAVAEAVRATEQSTGQAPVALEVSTVEDAVRRAPVPSDFPGVMGYSDIAELLGVSRQRARELATTRKDFPVAVAQIGSGPLFLQEAVEAWLGSWDRKPGRPRQS